MITSAMDGTSYTDRVSTDEHCNAKRGEKNEIYRRL